MIKPTLIAIIFSSTALTACAKPASDSNQKTQASIAQKNLSAEQQKQLQQLLEKTKKNLILVKDGTFMMGDFGLEHSIDKLPYDGKGDSSPLHKVTLDDFYLSATKATYADFDIYTDITGQKPIGVFDELSIKYRIPTAAAGINWQQARDYCQWLGQQLNLKMDIGRNIWSFEQRKAINKKFKSLSPLGLYDMITDNYEWMLDWYDPEYYSKSPEKNPQGPASGKLKVVRSSEPRGGQNLYMAAKGLTIQRHAIDPIADPKLVEYYSKKDYSFDYNQNNSVRCAVNP